MLLSMFFMFLNVLTLFMTYFMQYVPYRDQRKLSGCVSRWGLFCIRYFCNTKNTLPFFPTIWVLKLSMTYFMQYRRKKLLTKENSTGCALRWGLFYIRCFCNKNNTLPFTCMPKSSFLIDVHVNYDHYQCSLCS